jgi:hypothetical protein
MTSIQTSISEQQLKTAQSIIDRNASLILMYRERNQNLHDEIKKLNKALIRKNKTINGLRKYKREHPDTANHE